MSANTRWMSLEDWKKQNIILEEVRLCGPPRSKPTKSKVSKLHRNARKHLNTLLENQGNLCYWCYRPIISLEAISSHGQRRNEIFGLVGKWKATLQDFAPHIPIRTRIATVDHVKATSKGGNNDPDNLVAACMECNSARGINGD